VETFLVVLDVVRAGLKRSELEQMEDEEESRGLECAAANPVRVTFLRIMLMWSPIHVFGLGRYSLI
jgi:hypothetical protein